MHGSDWPSALRIPSLTTTSEREQADDPARTRAKFFIQTVSAYAVGNGEVIMKPATRGAENAEWAEATPSGEFKMTINNPPAFDFFRDNLAREVYIDITLVAPELADPTKHAFVLFDNPKHYNNGKCLHCGMTEDQHTGG